MSIRFTEEDWERIEKDWTLFWQGELKRPMVWLEHWEPAEESEDKKRGFISQYPKEMSVEEIIEIENKHLERVYFLGDSFPKFWPNFGAGSSATYFGSDVNVDENTVWFTPVGKELKDIEISINKECYWYKRIQSIIDAGLKKWNGLVQVGHTDIGGNLDIIASLRETEKVLFDLYDNPGILEKLVKDVTRAWIQIYKDEDDKIRSVCKGTTPWAPIWSKDKTYMLQCDFCYMISPKMFERFVLPDLTECCNFLDDGFYHLDGKGAIPHLDMLCSIENLKGIQWIPGDGQPEPQEWLDLLKRIRDAGKFCQVFVPAEGALKIIKELGGQGFIFHVWYGGNKNEAEDLFKKLTE